MAFDYLFCNNISIDEPAVDKKVAEDGKVEETLASEISEPPEESIEVSETAEETAQSAECVVGETEPEKELTHEQICQAIVENIQREEFGLGIQLDETGEKLMKVSGPCNDNSLYVS